MNKNKSLENAYLRLDRAASDLLLFNMDRKMVRMDAEQYGRAVSQALGARLRGLRAEHRLSRQALAAQLGKSESTLRRWENGTSSPEVLEIVQFLQCLGENEPVEDFLAGALKNVERPGGK